MNCINISVQTNACPCGYYPDCQRCRCTAHEVRQYLGRISGPILDRVDLCVQVEPTAFEEVVAMEKGESSQAIRERVVAARELQLSRFAGTSLQFNAAMGTAEVMRWCHLGKNQKRYMEEMYQTLQLSARGYHKILKVARTIADLEGSEEIQELHLAEAICYRQTEWT